MNRIKQLRKTLGYTQEQFGKRIGLKKPTISLLENGAQKLSTQNRLAILREFNVNPDWLDNGEGEMFIQFKNTDELMQFVSEITEADDSDIRKRLLNALAQLPPEDWNVIEEIIDTVKKQ